MITEIRMPEGDVRIAERLAVMIPKSRKLVLLDRAWKVQGLGA
jgi:hypothetical protein